MRSGRSATASSVSGRAATKPATGVEPDVRDTAAAVTRLHLDDDGAPNERRRGRP